MKRCLLILVVLLAGCASQQQGGQNNYGSNTGDSASRNRARTHTELGANYLSQGNLAVALEEFSTAAQADSGYAPAYNGLGLVYGALKEDDKAENSFRRSLQVDPGNSESHNNYGTFLCSRNRIDDSIKEFLAALKNPLYSTPESAWLNAGICALKKGDDKGAETYLLNALQAQPGIANAHYRLASIYFSRNDFASAGKHFQQAVELGEPSPELLLLGVRIARAMGDKNAEASYGMLLRNKYPDSEQSKTLRAESLVDEH